ncbi:MAG: UDP-N-acetylmuramate--L-alanine ligase [Lachnospiraceae bacterium]|nr:UDP-N-acetylmuramate--L-alanine ligase [Lachnospiraceae bacterium]
MKINFDNPLHVYFIGIGGANMSSLASIIMDKGFKVSGSDAVKSANTERIVKEGASVYYGQTEPHVTDDVDLVVYNAAIKEDNPDRVAAVSKNILCVTRAVFLGELMRNYGTPVGISGTHGKTSTTNMISEILLAADLDPTLSLGGVLPSINSTARDGGRDYFVFEACEYTNSFLSFYPRIEVILNIEEDHLDFFKDLADIRNSFRLFVERMPDDGTLVINNEIDNISEIVGSFKGRVITYGLDSSADYYATDITFSETGHPSFTCHEKETGKEFPVSLALTGIHNVANSLAAIAVARHVGLETDNISSALSRASGAKRRFEYRGEVNGVRVIDDFAHHPTEIQATIKAARNLSHRELWVAFQPHTYTRTKAFLNEFAKALSMADHVVLADVYEAREKDEYGCNTSNLYELMKKNGTDVNYFHDFKEIEKFLLANCTKGDLLITMGAGNIVNIADSITAE